MPSCPPRLPIPVGVSGRDVRPRSRPKTALRPPAASFCNTRSSGGVRRETDLGSVAEHLRARSVGEALADIAGPGPFVDRLDVGAEQLVDRGDQFEQRDAAAAGNVEYAALDPRASAARRLPITTFSTNVKSATATRRHRRPAVFLEHGRDEQRNHGRIGAIGVLPRAEDVEIADRDRFELVGRGEGLAIEFARQLGGPIG